VAVADAELDAAREDGDFVVGAVVVGDEHGHRPVAQRYGQCDRGAVV
jgi:hypothetical protein